MDLIDTEKKTLVVIILTLVTMITEITFGFFTHSMALFADGWHMGTHALALSLTYFTYILIRKFSKTKDFVFGTGKFGTLSGFTSSILLGITGIFIIAESFDRIIKPVAIEFNEAIVVAAIGLIVNAACILVMGGHGECCCEHGEHNHEKDYNFKAAYMHILADLMTSVFAIIALLSAKYVGFTLLDPIVGLIGGIIICAWAYGLIKTTGLILLDAECNDLKNSILNNLQNKVLFEELHVWKTSEDGYSALCRVDSNLSEKEIKTAINIISHFDMINVEYLTHNAEHQ